MILDFFFIQLERVGWVTQFFDFDLALNIQSGDIYITRCSKKNKQLYCSAHTGNVD